MVRRKIEQRTRGRTDRRREMQLLAGQFDREHLIRLGRRSTASMIGSPTLPTASDGQSAHDCSMASSMCTVVVLPFVPVTASQSAASGRRSRQASSTSPHTGTPRTDAVTSSGCVGRSPGEVTTRSTSGNSIRTLSYRKGLEKEAEKYFNPLSDNEMSYLYGSIFTCMPLEGGAYRIVIDEDLQRELNRVGVMTNATPFSVLLASINVLALKLTGHRDIIVGSPVTLREDSSLSSLVGWFLDTVLLRNYVNDSLTIREFISVVNKNSVEAMSHRFLPMEKILDRLDIPFKSVGSVLVHLIGGDSTRGTLSNLTSYHKKSGTPTFDINFTFREFKNGIELVCDYRTELFSKAAIVSIVNQYVNLLRHFVSNIDLPLRDLELSPMQHPILYK